MPVTAARATVAEVRRNRLLPRTACARACDDAGDDADESARHVVVVAVRRNTSACLVETRSILNLED